MASAGGHFGMALQSRSLRPKTFALLGGSGFVWTARNASLQSYVFRYGEQSKQWEMLETSRSVLEVLRGLYNAFSGALSPTFVDPIAGSLKPKRRLVLYPCQWNALTCPFAASGILPARLSDLRHCPNLERRHGFCAPKRICYALSQD
jgi:hypothetical protein